MSRKTKSHDVYGPGIPCFYECGRESTTNDHIIPVNAGGADRPQNYVPACAPCNNTRNEMPLDEYAALLGLNKPLPRGVTTLEYKLLTFPIERLTIIECEWCYKAAVVVREPLDPSPRRFCNPRHGKNYSRLGRGMLVRPS